MARTAAVIPLGSAERRTPRPPPRKRAAEPDEKPPRWQGDDDVFFHRSQLKVGTVLENFGRISHATLWTVIQVKTYKIGRTGLARPVATGEVTRLSDDLVLRRNDSNETRQLSFGTLSYSAIWRLPK